MGMGNEKGRGKGAKVGAGRDGKTTVKRVRNGEA
jgi:hypothetical protein